MRCKVCGAELPEGAGFCTSCGAKVPQASASDDAGSRPVQPLKAVASSLSAKKAPRKRGLGASLVEFRRTTLRAVPTFVLVIVAVLVAFALTLILAAVANGIVMPAIERAFDTTQITGEQKAGTGRSENKSDGIKGATEKADNHGSGDTNEASSSQRRNTEPDTDNSIASDNTTGNDKAGVLGGSVSSGSNGKRGTSSANGAGGSQGDNEALNNGGRGNDATVGPNGDNGLNKPSQGGSGETVKPGQGENTNNPGQGGDEGQYPGLTPELEAKYEPVINQYRDILTRAQADQLTDPKDFYKKYDFNNNYKYVNTYIFNNDFYTTEVNIKNYFYTYKDIDNDGVVELIISTDNEKSKYDLLDNQIVQIFSIKNNKVNTAYKSSMWTDTAPYGLNSFIINYTILSNNGQLYNVYGNGDYFSGGFSIIPLDNNYKKLKDDFGISYITIINKRTYNIYYKDKPEETKTVIYDSNTNAEFYKLMRQFPEDSSIKWTPMG